MMTTFKKGDIVLYGSDPSRRTGCVVMSDPRLMNNGHEACRLRGECFYFGTCPAAFTSWMEPAPVFFCASDRTWHTEALDKSTWIDAEIFYVLPWTVGALACPTGVGWAYRIGSRAESADSYEAARTAIEKAFGK